MKVSRSITTFGLAVVFLGTHVLPLVYSQPRLSHHVPRKIQLPIQAPQPLTEPQDKEEAAWASLTAAAKDLEPKSSVPFSNSNTAFPDSSPFPGFVNATAEEGILNIMLAALNVMQDKHFEVWRGTWPSAIDWTAAVMGTQVSGALRSISRSSSYSQCDPRPEGPSENTVAGYFTQVASFYFGENSFSLRSQAYDDMLWVVLGWLEAIRLIEGHSDRHFAGEKDKESVWFAKHFIPGFAHRARIFWDLASQGWDTTLCGGGMIWNPRLMPYKNAITNELYISASASMYLYFPGDDNGFPFGAGRGDAETETKDEEKLPSIGKHDQRYLDAAVEAYDWLMNSGMQNKGGLFTDGFHIAGYKDPNNIGTGECNVRDEKVYTYNQGVALTGQRALWEATGNTSYLRDGHNLIIQSVRATGYSSDGDHYPHWKGMGRLGIIEETCDRQGDCSQDGQTFKGIFFHHLAEFCEPLPVGESGSVFHKATEELADKHAWFCGLYGQWVRHNARAALRTTNDDGEFGMWWTPGFFASGSAVDLPDEDHEEADGRSKGTDYRNYGVPVNTLWRLPSDPALSKLNGRSPKQTGSTGIPQPVADPNDRGRGRTVETQSGGVALLKSLYRLTQFFDSRRAVR